MLPRIPAISAHTCATRIKPYACRTAALRRFGPICFNVTKRQSYFNDGYTGSYDPNAEPGRGPMFAGSRFGVPQFYPRDLKKEVDDYVVGQDRAKKTICSTIFNHYQTMKRRRQHEHDVWNAKEKFTRQRYSMEKAANQKRREMYNSKDERYIDQNEPNSQNLDLVWPVSDSQPEPSTTNVAHNEATEDVYSLEHDGVSPDFVTVEKSNLLLLGPTGVGKTYILETLSKKLKVPFSICDCNSLTQAGYVGQDVESCIERLLIEANYDVNATEHGIVVLDEFDKLARREMTTGRDVSGEGVQQALLKLVEGTKVTVNSREFRSSKSTGPASHSGPQMPGSSSSGHHGQPGNKSEQYTIDTKNILFVFSGAFVGLDKIILRRISKPSMGFGNEIRKESNAPDGEDVLSKDNFEHLPHYNETIRFTATDLVTPSDLQLFGFIPELIGRIHNLCSLSPLSISDLYRILVEPRNSLVAQYTSLFETYPSNLYFTEKALHAIAARAHNSGTGARGLRLEMERVLAEPIYDAPVAYVLVTEACVNGQEKARYWGKSGKFEVERILQEEAVGARSSQQVPFTFEYYRQAGQSGG